MTVLETEAEAARQAQEAEDQAAADQAAADLRAAAMAALRAVLVRPDGTYLTPKDAGLASVHEDLDNGLAIVGDGVVHLAVRQGRGGEWRVWLVELQDGEWTRASTEPIDDLAELGRFLAAEGASA